VNKFQCLRQRLWSVNSWKIVVEPQRQKLVDSVFG